MRADAVLHYPYVLILPAIAIILAAATVVALFLRRRRSTGRRLERVLQRAAIDQLRDIVIPDGLDGHIHIERLLLTEKGALVVDFKDVPGMIFAGARMDEWTVMDTQRRHTFRNPIGPLQDRIAAVRLLAPGLPADGRIIFSDAGQFPKGMPDRVSLLSEFAAGAQSDKLVPQQYKEAWQALTARVAAVQDSQNNQ